MKIGAFVVAAAIGGLSLVGRAPAEEGLDLAELAYSELISYGIINAYSTNVLVETAFSGKCLSKEEGLDAVKRNLAFVKVLQRYADSLKRSSKTDDEGMKKLIADMCEVTTYLEQQTNALKDWIGNPENKSARELYNRDSEKVEKKVELMLRK